MLSLKGYAIIKWTAGLTNKITTCRNKTHVGEKQQPHKSPSRAQGKLTITFQKTQTWLAISLPVRRI